MEPQAVSSCGTPNQDGLVLDSDQSSTSDGMLAQKSAELTARTETKSAQLCGYPTGAAVLFRVAAEPCIPHYSRRGEPLRYQRLPAYGACWLHAYTKLSFQRVRHGRGRGLSRLHQSALVGMTGAVSGALVGTNAVCVSMLLLLLA